MFVLALWVDKKHLRKSRKIVIHTIEIIPSIDLKTRILQPQTNNLLFTSVSIIEKEYIFEVYELLDQAPFLGYSALSGGKPQHCITKINCIP